MPGRLDFSTVYETGKLFSGLSNRAWFVALNGLASTLVFFLLNIEKVPVNHWANVPKNILHFFVTIKKNSREPKKVLVNRGKSVCES